MRPFLKKCSRIFLTGLISFSWPSFQIHASEGIKIDRNTPFRYVYMSFQQDWEHIPEAIEIFFKECRKQDLKPANSGNFFLIVFNDEIPSWAIGCRIDEKISAASPILKSRYGYVKVAHSIHAGTSDSLYQYARELKSFINEKSYVSAGPMVIFWPDKKDMIQSETLRFNIIQPIKKNYSNTITQILLSLSVFLCLFIAFFLLSNRKCRSMANLFFAAMLISYAFGRFDWLLHYHKNVMYTYALHFNYLGDALFVLTTPFLLLYFQAITNKGFKLKSVHLIHTIPFLLCMGELIFRYSIHDADTKRALLNNATAIPLFPKTDTYIIGIAIEVQRYFCYILMLIILKKYKNELNSSFSLLRQTRLNWLTMIICVKLIIEIIVLVKHNLTFITGAYDEIFIHIVQSFDLVFFMILLYMGMKHNEVFTIAIRHNGKTNWTLPQFLVDNFETRLRIYMENEKPFLDPALTLDSLAESLSISPRYLSMVINKTYNQNFFTYINSYRVKEAQNMLTCAENKKKILEVLYESGFNSKSVFNDCFRKHTGLTPSEYRRGILADN